jgi:hypothetical protein
MGNRRHLAFAAATALLAAAGSAAHANPLPPGATVLPDIFPLTGVTVTSTSGTFVSDLGDFSGSYKEFLLRGNSFGANDLTWYIEVTNDDVAGNSDINSVTASSFKGFDTDVGYCITSGAGVCGNEGTVLPTSVHRSSTGSAVDFTVDIPADGSESDWLMIETNANKWTAGHLSIQNDGNATVSAFAPTVPETSTWAMMLLGFAGLGYAGLRTRKTSPSIA